MMQIDGEHPTRTNGEKVLILRAQSARKMSTLTEKRTSGILPIDAATPFSEYLQRFTIG
jgi:hypothetical protein